MTVQDSRTPTRRTRRFLGAIGAPLGERVAHRGGRHGIALVAILLACSLSASAQPADLDNDGVVDAADNCVDAYNPDQHDDDQDLYGDVCDPDLNNDGVADALDVADFKRLMGTGDLEGDLSGDGQVDFRDLGLLSSMLGTTPGPRGVTAAELDPPYAVQGVYVDPVVQEIPGFDNFPPRPVGRIADENGHFDFVLDEVLLVSDDPQDAEDLAARHGGVVMTSFDPGAALGQPGPGLYLVQVDTTGYDTSLIVDGLKALAPQIHGGLVGSGQGTAELLALILDERRNHGLDVSFNGLMERNAFAERTTTEAASAFPTETEPFSTNAFEWTTHERDPDLPGDGLWPLDTRVGEAWRVMDVGGHIWRRSRAMVWDGGFWPNADFPPFTAIGTLRTPNTDPGGCGTGAPATFGSDCEAHGTHTVVSGFGLPDNSFGSAGPGGPVTDLTLLNSPAIDVGGIIRFILRQIPAALSTRPDVINISAGFDIPAGWCIFACPPLNLLTRELTDAGLLVVAAGGNQNRDIDHEDQFCFIFDCIRFESSTYAPCELDDVLCVGATEHGESLRASYSNWGSKNDANSIDIFAPGDVWSVDARMADSALSSPDDRTRIVSGTSFASPFVSGVATLVNSARPSLRGRQIRDCILRTAHTSSRSFEIRRRVNALAAVSCARNGRTHPYVDILSPLAGARFQQGLEQVPLRATADDFEDGTALSIDWSSSRDGSLVSSSPGATANYWSGSLSRGAHVITARVTDSTGLAVTDTVDIFISNPLPILTIVTPTPGAREFVGRPITLTGTSSDPNETPGNGPLSDTQVWWTVNGSSIGTGHTRTYTPTTTGSRTICFNGVDDDGEAGVPDCVTIQIDPLPSNAPPEVTIHQPTANPTYTYSGDPIAVRIDWTTTDDEDGFVPFGQHRFLLGKRATGTSPPPFTMVDVTAQVRVQTLCLFHLPFPPYTCQSQETRYYLDVEPLPTTNTTEFLLRIEAWDSTPAPDTGTDDASTTFSIYQFF